MFYYPTVLKRHTGCFSTIWLVATKGIRVPRRDFLKVNVKSTCDDIMNYVLEQVPPPRPGLPRPRFSLYLSSQLQYGVVVVYHRQCAILLEELQSVVGQLLKRPPSKIDMVEQSRQALDFPDALSLQEETEGAPDPLFGVMYMKTLTPSPTSQMGLEYLRETSPEHPEVTSPAAPDDAAAVGITASPDTITLREMEPVALPAAEFEGVELVDQHPETIDLLLAQTDHFTEEDVETQREAVSPGEEEMEMEMEMERGGPEGDLVKEGTKELTGSTIELQPTTVSSEDAMLMLQEEPGLSVEKPGPTTDQLTPVSVPVIPSPPSAERERQRPALESEDVSPPEVRTRRRGRRQLIFFDPNTQLSEKLQEQIDNPEAETGRPPLLLSSSRRRLPAAELLDNPCTLLPEEIQFLWRQAATVTPVSGLDLLAGDRGPESTDSEKEREREAAEREEETPEFSFKEVPRGVAEPEMMPELSGNGSLPLEGFVSREASREISPMYTPETEGSPVSRSVSILQDIPEVQEELEKTPAPESPGLPPLELAEHVASPVLFESLLPPEVDRRTVSQSFQRLLGPWTALDIQTLLCSDTPDSNNQLVTELC